MDQMLDESAELANLRLKLRSDLDFDFQEQGKDGCYVVLDETSSGYFQIGIPEYALLSMMDGGTTLQEAVQETSHRLGDEALTVRDAVRITHWALESGLASVVGDDGVVINNSNRWLEKDESIAKQSIVSRLNPLFIRVPLGNPARLIAAVATPLGWLCSKSFLLVWLAVVGLAFFQLLQHSAAILTASSQILVADSWLWMLVTLGVLKVIHELAHGLFCHRFGGRTKEVGLVFILFIPMPYVDVTSCWGFDSKWKRIAVASAGMYAEILLAAIATLVWSYSSDPVIRFHMMNVMILGSLTTLFFNANFLMRFDGYYVLSDLVEIPNLYQKGQQFVHGLGKRWILGLHRANEDGSVSQRVTIQAYGLAAFVWRILICVSLTILAAAMFYGFGIVLAVISAAMWLGMPTFQFFKNWRDPATGNSVDPKWISCVTAPLIACLVAAMVYLPWPAYSSAPALVEYDAPANVRCEAAGFIQRVHVVAGQQVRQGDLLVELENHELKLQLEKLTLDIDKSVLRSRTFLPDRDIVAYQSEQLLRETLEQQQAELQQKLSTLKLLAATDGKIVGVDLESLPGQFVTSGTSLMKIVDESNKKITLSIGQQDFDTFSMNDQQLAVFAPRHGWVRHAGILNSVKPTATTTVDGRLASFSGGQLPVRQTESTAKTPAAENPFELVAARFNGELSIDVDTAKSLKAGVTGQVRLNDFSETIGEHLVIATRQWLKSNSDALRN